MTNDDRPPLAQRLEVQTREARTTRGAISDAHGRRGDRDHTALRRAQVDAAKTILMLQIHADRAKFHNRQSDEAQQILELVLKRKAELAALDQDNNE